MRLNIPGVPQSVTADQLAAYRAAHLANLRSIGIDPAHVVRGGIEVRDAGLYVTVIAPHPAWDGSTPPPSTRDEDTVATHRVWVPVLH